MDNEFPEYNTWVEWVARSGYAARGLVYLIVGVFAALAAIGAGQSTSSEGALEIVFQQSFGSVMLVALTVGLLMYSLWRILQSVLDADGHGFSLRGSAVRFGLFFSAITHVLLALYAVTLLRTGKADDGEPGEDWTVWLLAHEWGQIALAAIAIGMAVAAVSISWKGITAGFQKWFHMDNAYMRFLGPICRFGLFTRGLIMFLFAGFLGIAAWRSSSAEKRGLEESLEWVQSLPFGPYLLGFIALGLISFATYSFCGAIFRQIRVDELSFDNSGKK